MRKTLPPEIENGRRGGPPGGGPFGAFELACPETGRTLFVMASDGRDWGAPLPAPSERQLRLLPPPKRALMEALWAGRKEITLPPPAWEHASVSARIGLPRWEEMCWVRGVFWEPGEWVVQFHPAAADNLSVHDATLHLWRPVGAEFPVPPKECV